METLRAYYSRHDPVTPAVRSATVSTLNERYVTVVHNKNSRLIIFLQFLLIKLVTGRYTESKPRFTPLVNMF